MSIRITPMIGTCGAVSDDGEFCIYENRKGGKPHKGNHSWYVKPDPVPPTMDEMLEAVAKKLTEDVASIMTYCVDEPTYLEGLYRSISRKGRGMIIMPRW